MSLTSGGFAVIPSGFFRDRFTRPNAEKYSKAHSEGVVSPRQAVLGLMQRQAQRFVPRMGLFETEERVVSGCGARLRWITPFSWIDPRSN